MAELVVEAIVVLAVLIVLLVMAISYLFIQNAEKTGKLETYANALKEANNQIAILQRELKSFRSDFALLKHDHRRRLVGLESGFTGGVKAAPEKFRDAVKRKIEQSVSVTGHSNPDYPVVGVETLPTTSNADTAIHHIISGNNLSASALLVRDVSNDLVTRPQDFPASTYDGSSYSSSASSPSVGMD